MNALTAALTSAFVISKLPTSSLSLSSLDVYLPMWSESDPPVDPTLARTGSRYSSDTLVSFKPRLLLIFDAHKSTRLGAQSRCHVDTHCREPKLIQLDRCRLLYTLETCQRRDSDLDGGLDT